MRLGRMINTQSLTQTCTTQTISRSVHNWNTFGVRTSHKQIWTHKTHHDLNLGGAITFPLIIYIVAGHKTSVQMAFCPGSPKIPKVGTPVTSGAHNFVYRLLIDMQSQAKL